MFRPQCHLYETISLYGENLMRGSGNYITGEKQTGVKSGRKKTKRFIRNGY